MKRRVFFDLPPSLVHRPVVLGGDTREDVEQFLAEQFTPAFQTVVREFLGGVLPRQVLHAFQAAILGVGGNRFVARFALERIGIDLRIDEGEPVSPVEKAVGISPAFLLNPKVRTAYLSDRVVNLDPSRPLTGTGRVLLFAEWFEPLVQAAEQGDPGPLFTLLDSIRRTQGLIGVKEPSFAIVGNKAELLRRINHALRLKRLDVESFLTFIDTGEQSSAQSSEEAATQYVQAHHGAVSVLLPSLETHVSGTPAQFFIDREDQDLETPSLIVPRLLLVSELLAGVSDPAEQAELLKSNLDRIVPGAHPNPGNQVYEVSRAEFLAREAAGLRRITTSA